MARLLVILTLIIAILLFPPAVLALISNNAVPGDRTYPIKRGLENIIFAVASINPVSKAWFASARSDRRFEEISVLVAQKKSTSATIIELVNQTQIAADQIKDLGIGAEKKQLRDKLTSSVQKYVQKLNEYSQESISNEQPAVSPKPTLRPGVTPTPVSTLTPTPTPTPILGVPSILGISGLPNCISAPLTATQKQSARIIWTNPSSSNDFWVDISRSASFPNNNYYHKRVISSTATNMAGFNLNNRYPEQEIVIQPSVTYFVRVFDSTAHLESNSVQVNISTCGVAEPTPTPIPTPTPTSIPTPTPIPTPVPPVNICDSRFPPRGSFRWGACGACTSLYVSDSADWNNCMNPPRVGGLGNPNVIPTPTPASSPSSLPSPSPSRGRSDVGAAADSPRLGAQSFDRPSSPAEDEYSDVGSTESAGIQASPSPSPSPSPFQ